MTNGETKTFHFKSTEKCTWTKMRAIINNRYKSKLLRKSEQRNGKVKAAETQNEVEKV